MEINVGSLLVSSPILIDPNFMQSEIFIFEKNESGASGFKLNELFPRKFNDLIEFNTSLPFPLYSGGPVQKDKLYFIHCRPDLIENSKHIIDRVFMGGNFKQAVDNINLKKIQLNEICLFIGYCGWDANQLENEIKEGSWSVVNCFSDIVFST